MIQTRIGSNPELPRVLYIPNCHDDSIGGRKRLQIRVFKCKLGQLHSEQIRFLMVDSAKKCRGNERNSIMIGSILNEI